MRQGVVEVAWQVLHLQLSDGHYSLNIAVAWSKYFYKIKTLILHMYLDWWLEVVHN